MLKRNKYGWTPLHKAAQANNKSGAYICLLANGVDVNAKDKRGFTPLHWAADFNSKEVAEYLLTKGADVNAKDKYLCCLLQNEPAPAI